MFYPSQLSIRVFLPLIECPTDMSLPVFTVNPRTSQPLNVLWRGLLTIAVVVQRPPSSSLSYGAVNDDVRSPGSGGTPGPLSQPPPQTLDATDPGMYPPGSNPSFHHHCRLSFPKSLSLVTKPAMLSIIAI
jgi:hypothetical protein